MHLLADAWCYPPDHPAGCRRSCASSCSLTPLSAGTPSGAVQHWLALFLWQPALGLQQPGRVWLRSALCLPDAPLAGELARPKFSLLADYSMFFPPARQLLCRMYYRQVGRSQAFVCHIVAARWLPMPRQLKHPAPSLQAACRVSTPGQHPSCACLSAFYASALQGVPPRRPCQVGHAGAPAPGWGASIAPPPSCIRVRACLRRVLQHEHALR